MRIILPPQKGIITHNQDQVITSVSFSTTKTIPNKNKLPLIFTCILTPLIKLIVLLAYYITEFHTHLQDRIQIYLSYRCVFLYPLQGREIKSYCHKHLNRFRRPSGMPVGQFLWVYYV